MPLILFDILIMPINILSNTFVIKVGGEGHLAFVGVQGPSTFSLSVEFITLVAQFSIPGGKLKWLAWTSGPSCSSVSYGVTAPAPHLPSALFIVCPSLQNISVLTAAAPPQSPAQRPVPIGISRISPHANSPIMWLFHKIFPARTLLWLSFTLIFESWYEKSD